jgi:hypothetical protein
MRISILAAIILLLMGGSGWAESYCELGAPIIRKDGDHYRLKVAVTCSQTRKGLAVEYPDGSLYVGASLYRVDAGLAGKIVPFTTPGSETDVDLMPAELHLTQGRTEVEFEIDSLADSTHLLIAVWDQKNPCSSDAAASDRCQTFGYTLGATDDFGMPIPIDAWPRPVCHRESLIADGFFSWVKEGGDPSGHAMPDEFTDDYALNDCWSLVDAKGLGFSVRQWRIGPIPKPSM